MKRQIRRRLDRCRRCVCGLRWRSPYRFRRRCRLRIRRWRGRDRGGWRNRCRCFRCRLRQRAFCFHRLRRHWRRFRCAGGRCRLYCCRFCFFNRAGWLDLQHRPGYPERCSRWRSDSNPVGMCATHSDGLAVGQVPDNIEINAGAGAHIYPGVALNNVVLNVITEHP